MTREEIIDFCDMKAQLEPENEDIFKAIIKALEQDPKWISASERLPEDSGEYLVSIIDEYNENQSYYKAVGIAWFAHKKDYDIKESEWRELGIDETVIAWMPLPKPYKTESEKE